MDHQIDYTFGNMNMYNRSIGLNKVEKFSRVLLFCLKIIQIFLAFNAEKGWLGNGSCFFGQPSLIQVEYI